ncbi:hypothetical protein FOA52_003389 [Chlamydomonas sp. UWO 241]|nr:hypothetical protein FOA52_003389 [Chlamydomonas sp. UWO 241]
MPSQVPAQEGGRAVGAEVVPVQPRSRYIKGELIGQGAQKKVYKAFDEELGLEVAWNEVAVSELANASSAVQESVFGEIRVLKQLSGHKNIIKLYDWWYDPKERCICFVTELFTDGTLRQYRRKHRNNVDLIVLKRWAWQILQGLVYLHGHDPPLLHRDLKSDNIFVNGSSGVVKIGDLGFATVSAGLDTAMSVIGTPEYMAPELYEETYGEKVDVYSLGMCLLELDTLEYPYAECKNAAQIFKKVTAGIPPQGLERVSCDELRNFIIECISHDAAQRPEARQLLKHPFFACMREGGGGSIAKTGTALGSGTPSGVPSTVSTRVGSPAESLAGARSQLPSTWSGSIGTPPHVPRSSSGTGYAAPGAHPSVASAASTALSRLAVTHPGGAATHAAAALHHTTRQSSSNGSFHSFFSPPSSAGGSHHLQNSLGPHLIHTPGPQPVHTSGPHPFHTPCHTSGPHSGPPRVHTAPGGSVPHLLGSVSLSTHALPSTLPFHTACSLPIPSISSSLVGAPHLPPHLAHPPHPHPHPHPHPGPHPAPPSVVSMGGADDGRISAYLRSQAHAHDTHAASHAASVHSAELWVSQARHAAAQAAAAAAAGATTSDTPGATPGGAAAHVPAHAHAAHHPPPPLSPSPPQQRQPLGAEEAAAAAEEAAAAAAAAAATVLGDGGSSGECEPALPRSMPPSDQMSPPPPARASRQSSPPPSSASVAPLFDARASFEAGSSDGGGVDARAGSGGGSYARTSSGGGGSASGGGGDARTSSGGGVGGSGGGGDARASSRGGGSVRASSGGGSARPASGGGGVPSRLSSVTGVSSPPLSPLRKRTSPAPTSFGAGGRSGAPVARAGPGARAERGDPDELDESELLFAGSPHAPGSVGVGGPAAAGSDVEGASPPLSPSLGEGASARATPFRRGVGEYIDDAGVSGVPIPGSRVSDLTAGAGGGSPEDARPGSYRPDLSMPHHLHMRCRRSDDDAQQLAFSLSFANHRGVRKKVGFMYHLWEDQPELIAHEMVVNLSLNSQEAAVIAQLVQARVEGAMAAAAPGPSAAGASEDAATWPASPEPNTPPTTHTSPALIVLAGQLPGGTGGGASAEPP